MFAASKIAKTLNSYKKNTKGNVAMMFAASVFAMLVGAGVAVDTGMAHKTKLQLQNTADSAVLAAAKSGETDAAALKSVAEDYVDANGHTIDNLATTLTLTPNGRVRVGITGEYKTFIVGILGKSKIDVAVVSEAPLASSEPVNVALVLDVTGSMSGSKMDSLKTAAGGLIDTLESYDNDSLKVSVVPFSNYVNVGLSRRDANWLDVPDDSSTAGGTVCRWKRDVTSRTNCRQVTETCYNDGVAYSCTRTRCDYTYGPRYQECTASTVTKVWRGCVGSRNTPWNERAHYAGKKIPGLMNARCNEEILPLTTNLGSVKSKINSLSARGNTYIPAGLSWGWRTLDTNAPLTEANGPFANNTGKFLVLMTDGANTKSKNGDWHEGGSVSNANDVTRNLCNNIKSSDIQVYTIAYEITDTTTKNLMRNCASKSSMYFDASNSAQLSQAFDTIGNSLIKLRLTH
jgi:Flp pilus assembly protein TadG